MTGAWLASKMFKVQDALQVVAAKRLAGGLLLAAAASEQTWGSLLEKETDTVCFNYHDPLACSPDVSQMK